MALFYIYILMKEPLQLKISPSSTICLIPLRRLSQEEDKNSSHLCHEKKEPVQKKTWSLPCWVKGPHKEVDFSLTCGREIRGLLSRMRVGTWKVNPLVLFRPSTGWMRSICFTQATKSSGNLIPKHFHRHNQNNI